MLSMNALLELPIDCPYYSYTLMESLVLQYEYCPVKELLVSTSHPSLVQNTR